MLKRFMYPEDSDMEKCKEHVMAIAGKAHQNFRYKINKEYVQKGRSPCARYNYVLPEVYEEFIKQKQIPEAKLKS
jgi:hypothetical protein